MLHKLITGFVVTYLAVMTSLFVVDHTTLKVVSDKMDVQISRLVAQEAALTELAKPKPVISYSEIRKTVYVVQVGTRGSGSGVMIGPNRMLTAAHVAVNGTPEDPLLVNGKVAKVLKIDEELDLALLEVDIAHGPYAPLGALPGTDANVVAIGFPLNNSVKHQILTNGRVQGTTENRTMVTTPIAPGNSGGGLFRYRNGKWELVGLTVAVAMVPIYGMYPNLMSHLCLSVDADTIKAFLKGTK